MSTRWVRGDDEPDTWTSLDNATIHDDLSCRALGLLLRWVSRPPGVEIDGIDGMVSRAKYRGHASMEGRKALQAAARELEIKGYLVRERWQGDGGSWNTTNTIFKRPVPPGKRSNPDDRKHQPKAPAEASEVPEGTFGPTCEDEAKPQVAPKVPYGTSVAELPLGTCIPLSTLGNDSPSLHVGEGAEQTANTGAEAVAAAEPHDVATIEPSRVDVEQVCRALADAIEANGSRRPVITKGWRNEARLLLDRDGRTVEQVLIAIAWCQSHPFWRSNILSMPKLRQKYDQMRLQAQREPSQPLPRQMAYAGAYQPYQDPEDVSEYYNGFYPAGGPDA